MNELTSNEIPRKFSEWLLEMGCHPDVLPSVEKVAEKCRGQYYMVWRSLMEKVEPKDAIKTKRPQVFCDDVWRCQEKNVFNEREVNTVVPEELLLWHRHNQLKEKVSDAEARIRKEKEENLRQLEDKNNNRLCQLYILRKRIQDGQRRALLLQRLADELRSERANLLETKTIAESLCGVTDDTDVEGTLDKCMAVLTRQGNSSKLGGSLASAANPAANSTFASTNSDDEEVLSSLARCRGEVLFKQLYERRAGLCAEIPTNHPHSVTNTKRVQSVVCNTASLHCSLALAAKKNRIHGGRTREKLANTFLELDDYLSSEACELLVTRCEAACSEARVASLRSSLEEIAARGGAFATEWQQDNAASLTAIHSVDRAIESKRDELKRLVMSVAAVERKTQNVRERLLFRFDSFHDDALEKDRSRGVVSLSQESIPALRRFYEEIRAKRRHKQDLSMNLDISDISFNDIADNESPTFIDELKLYLNKFCLEKNRKIVMENGEKIWIFESTNSCLHDIHNKLQSEDVTTSMLFPYVGLKQNLRRLVEGLGRKEQLESLLRALGAAMKNGREIDISSLIEEEQKSLDRIKKRLNENMLSLQKTSKNLDVGMENLQFWADNCMRKYISDRRMVDGRIYMQYERAYLNSF